MIASVPNSLPCIQAPHVHLHSVQTSRYGRPREELLPSGHANRLHAFLTSWMCLPQAAIDLVLSPISHMAEAHHFERPKREQHRLDWQQQTSIHPHSMQLRSKPEVQRHICHDWNTVLRRPSSRLRRRRGELRIDLEKSWTRTKVVARA